MAEKVIALLTGLVGVMVTVTLEISAEIPIGVPDKAVPTVIKKWTLNFELALSCLTLHHDRSPFGDRTLIGRTVIDALPIGHHVGVPVHIFDT